MNSKEALETIKLAEQKVQTQLAHAEQQSRDILDRAGKKKIELLNAAVEMARQEGEKLQERNESELRMEIERLDRETEAEIKKLHEKALRNRKKVLAIIRAKMKL